MGRQQRRLGLQAGAAATAAAAPSVRRPRSSARPPCRRWIKARSPKEKLYLGIAGGVIVSRATHLLLASAAAAFNSGSVGSGSPAGHPPPALAGAAAALVCCGGPRHAVHPQRERALPGHWRAGLEADQEEGGRRCARFGSRSCGMALGCAYGLPKRAWQCGPASYPARQRSRAVQAPMLFFSTPAAPTTGDTCSLMPSMP